MKNFNEPHYHYASADEARMRTMLVDHLLKQKETNDTMKRSPECKNRTTLPDLVSTSHTSLDKQITNEQR